MYTFADHQLGQTDDTVAIETREHNRLAVAKMAGQCSEHIEIISRDLDPSLYDTVEFIDAVKKMLLNHRRARVRVMLIEPQTVVTYGHRFLNLAMNMSSFVELRKSPTEYDNFNEAIFIADATGYLHRANTSRFEGEVNFNDKRTAKSFLDRFEVMWDKAKPDVNLRRLSI